MSHAASAMAGAGEDVTAALTFIVPQETKPYFESAALTGGEPRVHFRTEQREVTVHDMRPIADVGCDTAPALEDDWRQSSVEEVGRCGKTDRARTNYRYRERRVAAH